MGQTYPFGEPGIKGESMANAPIVIKATVQPESLWDGLTDIWSDMGTSVSGTWDSVESTVAQAWDTTYLTAYGAVLTAEEKVVGAADVVKDTFSNALNAGDGIFSWLQGKLLWFLGVGILVLVILAKSGILPQIADTFRAVYGG